MALSTEIAGVIQPSPWSSVAPNQADNHLGGAQRVALGAPRAHQSEPRQDAAFTVVVGAHDQDRVFDRDDDNQRPEDQRDNAEDRLGRHQSRGRSRPGGGVEGVELVPMSPTPCRRAPSGPKNALLQPRGLPLDPCGRADASTRIGR
jgi:hypothetical protein